MSSFRNASVNLEEPHRKKRRLHYSCHRFHNLLWETTRNLRGPPRIEVWREILFQLEEPCFETRCIHDLQRKVFIHLGCTLALSPSDGIGDARQELILTLCRCWLRVLEQLKPAPVMHMNSFEQCEGVDLLSQILERRYDNIDISMACLDIGRHATIWKSDVDSPRQERLLTSILRLIANQSIQMIIIRALLILERAAKEGSNSSYANIVYSAALVSQFSENHDLLHQESPMIQYKDTAESNIVTLGARLLKNESEALATMLSTHSEKEIILFLKCLTMSSKVAAHFSHSEPVIECLYSFSIKDTIFSKDSAYCLSSIGCSGEYSQMLVDKLIGLLCRADSVAVKRNAIPGLVELLKNHSSTLPERKSYMIVSSLSALLRNDNERPVVDDGEGEWCLHATQLLSHLSEQQAKRGEWSNQAETSLLTLACLIERDTDIQGIVGHSLECLLELSSSRALLRGMARLDKVLVSIARVATNDFVSAEYQSTAMLIVWNLAQETANLTLLARTPKVLEALVAVASSTNRRLLAPTTSFNNDARQCALRTLMKLSELVSNRRILAKQVGLLACLIRYTRRMIPNEDESVLRMTRDELKDRILKIALLL